MSMRKRSTGFTLVELMMVVGTIGLLAAIALPAYQDYIQRSKMVDVFVIADIGRRAVAEYYERWGVFPDGNAQAGLAAPEAYRSRYVRDMRIEQGAVKLAITFGGAFSPSPSKELNFGFYLRPMVNKSYPTGPIGWTCTGTEKAPATFAVIGTAGTDTPAVKHLPAVCR
jgi:type IV pilus assembly protein PilA